MSSIVDSSIRLPSDSVVEYCIIEGSLTIGRNSLLSHCRIVASLLPKERRSLPDDIIVHTIAVRIGESRGVREVENDGNDELGLGKKENLNEGGEVLRESRDDHDDDDDDDDDALTLVAPGDDAEGGGDRRKASTDVGANDDVFVVGGREHLSADDICLDGICPTFAFASSDDVVKKASDGRTMTASDVAFVTVAFRIEDDLKKSFDFQSGFRYFGRRIVFDESDFADDSRHDRLDSSLWNCPLFEAKPSMEDSVAHTMNLAWSCLEDEESPLELEMGGSKFSVEDAVNEKDVGAMLQFRSGIAEDVTMKCGFLF